MGDLITFGIISRAVADTLKAVKSSFTATPVIVQNYDEITEGVNDWPLLQVLPRKGKVDPFASNTERSSFGGKVQATSFSLEIIGYAKPRAYLAEDLKAQMALVDGVDVVLSSQNGLPQFGLQAVKGFNWDWERQTLQIGEGDSAQKYAGVVFTVELFIF